MVTSHAGHTLGRIVLTAVVVGSTCALLVDAQTALTAPSPLQSSSGREPYSPPARASRNTAPEKYAYSWPIQPFRRQHPVRGYFGDPRIANHRRSRQFHFGIDISAPNGTPVFATLTGTASIHPLHATTILIASPRAEFSYWHVIPAISNGQRVVAYRTVIGHVEAPYAHVHFSEMRGGRYLNPLRPGALGPYRDDTRPTIRSVVLDRDLTLVAQAYDETPIAIPRPWHDLPVMPALVRWRVLDAKRRPLTDWSSAVDFRLTIPPKSSFDNVWARGTAQNHVRAPGRYRVVLSRGIDALRPGSYLVEIAVRDTRDNGSSSRFAVVRPDH
jgi:hypothetical protein